jgi:hypothetical protein
VADAPLTGSSAASASGNEGASVSLTNATFTDANPGDHTADFTATIDWGDGTAPTTGTVSYNSVTKVYTIAGSHTYAEEGTYTPTVTVKDNVDVGGTSSTTITGTATIINPEPENNVVKFNDVLPANFTPIENPLINATVVDEGTSVTGSAAFIWQVLHGSTWITEGYGSSFRPSAYDAGDQMQVIISFPDPGQSGATQLCSRLVTSSLIKRRPPRMPEQW